MASLGSLNSKDSALVAGRAKILMAALLPAFQYFLTGVSTAAPIAGLGYINWSVVTESYWTPSDWYIYRHGGKPDEAPKRHWWVIEGTRFLGCYCFWLRFTASVEARG